MKRSYYKQILIMAVILLGAFGLSLFLGKYPLKFADLWAREDQAVKVFMTLRFPRTLMAIVGGFGLGAAGMVYQIVFKNPLAAPDIIGVSSGASSGAAFAMLFLGGGFFTVTTSAFAGSLLALILALVLAKLAPGKATASIVLSGIAVHSIAQTVLMILKITADPEKELASIEYWIMGSLNAITLSKIPAAVIITIIGSVCLFVLYRHIIILSADEDEAELLGVPVNIMRLIILSLATLVVAAIISVTGLISFIGLLAPHTARLMTKNHRISTLLLSGMMGSVLLCIADILARTAANSELPVSVFTSLLGAPFLIYLLMRKGARA